VPRPAIIGWDRDDEGIVVLTIDDPSQSVNTMNQSYVDSMDATLERLEAERERIAGVVITSAKKTFFAGGDLREFCAAKPEDADRFAELMGKLSSQLRRLETLGRPVVAAINGAALGGGFEIALAAHHRVLLDDPSAVVGSPEVTLGLLPAAGGVVRSVRMLGVVEALTKLLLTGDRLPPAQAAALGVVDELVGTPDELVPVAKAWIRAHPDAIQPWDVEGHEIPGGTPTTTALAQDLPALPANLRRQLKGANYPAPKAILAAAVETAQVDVDSAFAIECRYFVQLVVGQVSTNLIQSSFLDMQTVTRDRGHTGGGVPFEVDKVAVLGAGMMGAAIAYVCARVGMEVALKDVSLEAAERGKGYSVKLLEKSVARGSSSRGEADQVLSRITPTADAGDAAGANLVIEAVFEDAEAKQQAFAEIEPYLAEGALLGTNTSTLPVSQLAENGARPADFIGLHFFSPVDKMPLLEIVRGRQTSDETLARALDVARRIEKTPIVVNDRRGFFTSRVIGRFISEGIAMLTEGIPAPTIEQASAQAGYPAAVLQLADELNLKLMRKVRNAAEAAGELAESGWDTPSANGAIDAMLDRHDRPGRLEGRGFYDYEDGKRVGLWPGLPEAFPHVDDPALLSLQELKERMLFVEALEAVKCLDEGVIESVPDANVGSILGIGFPAWTGGVIQYIKSYRGGAAAFVARAHELMDRHGERFEPPASLVRQAERGEI
jgi:3-hydroxyacyl-CoA dehydrogenase / enoyl-CoA hydratase / 3-hydroxybutyryl-CoA epimerase